jgi:methionine-rich copper-binding protein CopC
MDPRLAIVSEGAPARELALGAGRTRVVVAPADQFRLLVAEQDATGPALRALRVDNALVVTGLPEGRELELSNFFGACRPGRDCALEIGPAGAPATVTLGNESAPIAALSDGSFLLLGSTTGLATLPAAVVPANEPGGPSPWLTGLVGLIGLGVAAGAAGGGGGGDEPTAVLGANATAPTPTAPAPTPPTTPSTTPSAPATPTTPTATDTTAPTLSITDGTAAAVTNAPTTFTFRFSEAVSGFDASDVRVTGGTAGALVAAGDGRTWTMTVAPAAGVQAGEIGVQVAAGAARDAAGNASGLASATQSIDTAAPALSISDGTAAATTNAPTTFTFRFGEAVSGFEAGDVRVTGGQAGALVAAGDGRTWTMTVTPAAGVAAGQIAVSVGAGAALDAAGNPSAPADAAQAYDTLAPGQRLSLFRVVDDLAPNTGTLVSGATTNDRTPTVTLTLDAVLGASETLTLVRNGATIRTLGAGASTVTLAEPGLAAATYAYTATLADAAGNTTTLDLNGSAAGTAFTIVVI